MWFALIRSVSKRVEKLQRSVVKRTHVAPVLASIPHDAVILEIGGGYNPRFRKREQPHIYHLDHASTADLRAKFAANPEVASQIHNIQEIDFVFDGRPIESLIPETLRFDVIFGSHVIEHQVDLVGHLQSLQKLLRPGGRVIELIPDLRTCFDALRYPTVTADALVAHTKRPSIHQGKQVFDSLAREIVRNLGHRMREADFEGVGFRHSLQFAYDAMMAAERPGAGYTDAHAWTFTPESFQLLMIELRLLGLIRLEPTYLSPQYGNQFCAVLQLANDPIDGLEVSTRTALEDQRLTLSRMLRFR